MAMRIPLLHRFRRAEDGSALVEFAISLPLILVVSFGMIDSMRLFWSYQAAVAGVRDAARYVARMAPDNICTTGASLADHLSDRGVDPQTIIDSASRIDRDGDGDVDDDDVSLNTSGVTITSVSTAITCVSTPTLRQTTVPVVRVSANMNITMPFSEILVLVGGDGFGTITTTIIEDARVFGV
jgi:Flp pilus assembly protein TadG